MLRISKNTRIALLLVAAGLLLSFPKLIEVIRKQRVDHYDKKHLASIFDQQVGGLISRNYHAVLGLTQEQFIASLEGLKAQLPEKMKVKKDHIPVLLVIPESAVPLEKQQSTILLHQGPYGYGDSWRVYEGMFRNLNTEISTSPYLLLDVETGEEIQGGSGIDALQKLLDGKRLALTADEGIALVMYDPNILRDREITMLGSPVMGTSLCPSIDLGEELEVRFFFTPWDIKKNENSFPSCKQRISITKRVGYFSLPFYFTPGIVCPLQIKLQQKGLKLETSLSPFGYIRTVSPNSLVKHSLMLVKELLVGL